MAHIRLMPVLSLSLMDNSRVGMTQGDVIVMLTELDNLFKQVFAHPSVKDKHTYGLVLTKTNPADVKPEDMIVYFVRDNNASLGEKEGGNHHRDHAGTCTNTPAGTIAEVYLYQNFPPQKLAKIAFHELMHYKIDVGQGKDTIIHEKGGGGIASANNVNAGTPLTAGNIAIMAKNIANKTKPYTKYL